MPEIIPTHHDTSDDSYLVSLVAGKTDTSLRFVNIEENARGGAGMSFTPAEALSVLKKLHALEPLLKEYVAQEEAAKVVAHDWEVVWTQGLLIYAGMDLEWETLEDGLTRAEAEGPKLREWQDSLNGAVGVLVKARQKPAPKEGES